MRRRYSRRYQYNAGYEAARRHLNAAARLSQELGGAERIVKAYFFGLQPRQLAAVLDEYEFRYGRAARNYAEETIPKWKLGKVQMGGQTAERLFDLLPKRMPLTEKYKVVEHLWNYLGPKSKKRLRIGLEVGIETVVETVRTHIGEVVTTYNIPPDLERRFDWLSAGDVSVKQDLLNYIRNAQKVLAVEAARAQVPVMLQHLSSPEGRHTQRLAQVLTIGKHELEIMPDWKSTGVTLEEPTFIPYGGRKSQDRSWGWILVAIILLALWLASRH